MSRDKLLTPAEAAEMLGLDLSTLANWRCERRRVPFVKIGRTVRYRLADIEKLLEDGKVYPIQEAKK